MPSSDTPADWLEDELASDDASGLHFPERFEDNFQEVLDEAILYLNDRFHHPHLHHHHVDDEQDSNDGSDVDSDNFIYESPYTSSLDTSNSDGSSESTDHWSTTTQINGEMYASTESESGELESQNLAELDPNHMSVSTLAVSSVEVEMPNIETDQESGTDSEGMSIEDAWNMLEDMSREQDDLEKKIIEMEKTLNQLKEDIEKNITQCDSIKFNP